MEVGGQEVGERPSGPGEVGICDRGSGPAPPPPVFSEAELAAVGRSLRLMGFF